MAAATGWSRAARLPPARVVSALALAIFAAAPANAAPVAFTPERWELTDASVQDYLGRSALSGTAWLKDVELGNGIIEVDVATDRQRAYPAVVFRRQADGDCEHVYLRPHRAGLYSDALQYAPIFNGVAGWQLYSGPGFTAGVTLPENQWVHLRIEVLGTQARVFVGDTRRPALVIDELKRGATRGAIGLQSPRDGSARFSSFSYTATDDLRFAPPELPEPVPGVLRQWELSPAGRVGLAPERYLDGQSPGSVRWTAVDSEPTGLVDIARVHKPFPGGASRVWARTRIQADGPGLRPFAFGYSDDVSIYLNGRLLFHGESGYRRRDPSFVGVVGWNDTIHLPLEKGANDLVLAVSDSFGGWGFLFRDLEAIGMHASLREEWEIAGPLAAPEAVAYDARRGALYVTNFGDGSISKIGLDGSLLVRNWLPGLQSPTGVKLRAGRLYVVERSGVVEIDPEAAKIVRRHPVPEPGFINDIDIDDAGTIYVSDSSKSCVHRIRNGKAEVWVQGQAVENPNGILVEKDRLLLGVTPERAIKAVDLRSKEVTTLVVVGGSRANMDGLTPDGRGGYLFSDYFGRIYRRDAQGQLTLLLDRRGPQRFCADFAFVPETGLLVVPSLFDNRLTAYRCHF